MTGEHILSLATGLKVCVAEYGSPAGMPVFFCHGWPASQCQAALLDAPAHALGLRILSIDRPGVGRSMAQPGRRLLDWPPLLGEIADGLGIASFRVLGVSGGGPYALATAWAMPDRVQAASVVCGAPPLSDARVLAGLSPIYRALLRIFRTSPQLLRWSFRAGRPLALARWPRWAVSLALRVLPAADATLLRDPEIFACCLANFQGAWSESAEGVFEDGQIYASPWGFAPEEIRVPVRLWHGRDDRNFSWKLAEDFACRLPRCETFFLEGEGHYSLPIARAHEILLDLREVEK